MNIRCFFGRHDWESSLRVRAHGLTSVWGDRGVPIRCASCDAPSKVYTDTTIVLEAEHLLEHFTSPLINVLPGCELCGPSIWMEAQQ